MLTLLGSNPIFFYNVGLLRPIPWPEIDFFPCFACYTNASEDPDDLEDLAASHAVSGRSVAAGWILAIRDSRAVALDGVILAHVCCVVAKQGARAE